MKKVFYVEHKLHGDNCITLFHDSQLTQPFDGFKRVEELTIGEQLEEYALSHLFGDNINFFDLSPLGDTYIKIGINMEKYGGSFMSAIGTALLKADLTNQRKLHSIFYEEFEKYAEMG